MIVITHITKHARDMPPLAFALLPLTLFALATGCAPAQGSEPTDPATQARRDAVHAAGITAPLTLLPVRVLGRPDRSVAEALGLVLEHQGMPDLEIGEQAFDAADAVWDAVPARLRSHVRGASTTGATPRYRLYAEFLGDPRSGPTEVRFVVVDSAGELVWADRQTREDRDFKRTAGRDPDPMGCATLVAERLFRLANWKKAPGTVRDGKLAELWRLKSGAPDKADLAAMAKRRAALTAALPRVKIAVLPTLAGAKPDAPSAQRLAELITAELGCEAAALPHGASLTVTPSSNEQKRLWGLATALRATLAKTPADADYVLVADIGLHPDGKRGFVHVVLATRAGDLVVTDFQNDQHPTFRAHAPARLEDAEKLAVARLAHLLR